MKLTQLKRNILSVLLIMLPISSSLCIDMYLPAYPSIAKTFGVHESAVNLSMSIYLFGLALGQLIYGPFADRYGRKPLIIIGLTLFLVASLVCTISPTLNIFLIARLFQALGACSCIVLCRTIVVDSYHPEKRTAMLALISATNIISPALAPLFGGYIASFYSWRMIFIVITVFGAIMLIGITMTLKETLLVPDYMALHLKRLISNLNRLLSNNLFTSYVIIIALLYSIVFVWVTSSPIILINHFKIPQDKFGLFFLMPAIGSTTGALISAKFGHLFRPRKLIGTGIIIIVIAIGSLSLLSFNHAITRPGILIAPIMATFFAMGLVTPQLMSDSLSQFTDIGGFTSGVLGFIQIISGSATGVIVSYLYSEDFGAMIILMVILTAVILIVFTSRVLHFRRTNLVLYSGNKRLPVTFSAAKKLIKLNFIFRRKQQ